MTKQKRWLVAGWAVLAVAALLWLPYRFSVAPTLSDSYLFGFNNRVGIAIVLVFGLGIAVFAPGFGISATLPEGEKPLSRSTLYKALALTLAASGALFLSTWRLGVFDESVYVIDRVKLLLDGRVAYRDFEWPYGVFFLYGPAWLARGLHLAVTDAYGLFWILVSVAGVGLLYVTLRWVDEPYLRVRQAFLLLFSVGLIALFCTGVNYSLLRFVLPCFLGVAVYRAIKRGAPQLGMLIVVPSYVALLLVSPELAISFSLGTMLYSARWVDFTRRGNMLAAAGVLPLLALVTWLANGYGTFLTLKTFGRGGFNFPIMPAPHILLFLVGIALCAGYMGRQIRSGQGSALAMLIFVSGAAVAGALGRCDGSHVFLDPLGITIAALLLGGKSTKWGKNYIGAMICIFILAPVLLDTTVIVSLSKDARQANTSAKPLDVGAVFGVPDGTVIAAPMGFTIGYFGTVHVTHIDEGYYYGLDNVLTPQAITRKINELYQQPEQPLLLPVGWQGACSIDPEAHRGFLRILFLYPYQAPARHQESINEPLCRFIESNYHLEKDGTPDRFQYEVWTPLK